MKIILRDAQTRMLKSKSGAWTSDPAEAVQFLSLEAAGEQAKQCGDQDVEVVLKYEEPPCELALNPVYCIRA